MKKVMLLAAMLAMALVVASPALAQQDVQSGDIYQECLISFGDQSVSADVDQANDQNQTNDQNSEDNTAAAASGDAAAESEQEQDAETAQGAGAVNDQTGNNIIIAVEDLDGDGDIDDADNVIAQNEANVGQEGAADAASGDASAAAGNQYSNQDQDAANVTNITQNVTQEQVAFCEQIAESVAKGELSKEEALTVVKGEATTPADQYDVVVEDGVAAVTEAGAAEAGAAEAGAAEAGAITELPSTGGASLLALGAGALLVGSGLIARRIFR